MRDDKLIEAMRESFEAWFSDDWQHPSAVERDAVGYKLAQAQNAWTVWQAAWQAALAALQETHAVVPRQYEAAMASSGPRSGHSVEVQFKDREGALEFYSALKGLGSDWVQRQLDYIAARKKAAPQTEEPRGINVSGHTYVRRSATSYVCRRCGHDMCREGPKPCANQQPEEAM